MGKKIQDWKKAEVKNLSKLMETNETVALCNLDKVRTSQIQETRKQLRGDITLKSSKNNLIRRALSASVKKKPDLEKLEEQVQGSTMLIFTNINPFKLSIMLQQNKVKLSAREGDIAIDDIVIPEGNTGIPPGPVISDFSEMGLPNKIESGSIWIAQDTVIVEKGQPISGKVASLLSRLGIKPMEGSLSLKAACEPGLIHLAEDLRMNLEEFKNELRDALSATFSLAINSGYPTPETLPLLLSKAIVEAKNLMFSSLIFESEIMPLILNKCYSQAVALTSKLGEKGFSLAA